MANDSMIFTGELHTIFFAHLCLARFFELIDLIDIFAANSAQVQSISNCLKAANFISRLTAKLNRNRNNSNSLSNVLLLFALLLRCCCRRIWKCCCSSWCFFFFFATLLLFSYANPVVTHTRAYCCCLSLTYLLMKELQQQQPQAKWEPNSERKRTHQKVYRQKVTVDRRAREGRAIHGGTVVVFLLLRCRSVGTFHVVSAFAGKS